MDVRVGAGPCSARRAGNRRGRSRVGTRQAQAFFAPFFALKKGPARRRREEFLLTVQRLEEHTPELQSLMRISYDVFCLKTQNNNTNYKTNNHNTTPTSSTQKPHT